LKPATSHSNQWALSNLELVSLSDLSTFYLFNFFNSILNKEFSIIC
jgi:hypothetical protein